LSESADKANQLVHELRNINQQGGNERKKTEEQLLKLQASLEEILNELQSIESKTNGSHIKTKHAEELQSERDGLMRRVLRRIIPIISINRGKSNTQQSQIAIPKEEEDNG
jgi:hypothetical protein